MLLITNGCIITMDKQRNIYPDSALAVEGSRIVELGQTALLQKKYPQAEVLDAKDKIVIPGLINAHTHLFQVLYRGLGDDVSLLDWLNKCIWPMSLYLRGAEAYHAALLAETEMLKAGVTTFVDSHYINADLSCQDRIAEATLQAGMRGVLGRCTVDMAPVPQPLREEVPQAVQEAERIIKAYHNSAGGLLTVRLEPLNEALASQEMLEAMRGVSRQYGIGMNMHIAEALPRTQAMTEKLGMSPIQYLHKLKVLGSDLLLAHCCWVDERDLELLAESDTRIAHNPVSNQYLGDGVAPVPQMLERGITVTIGSDGGCSNNNHDMFGTMKATALLHKGHCLDPQAVTAEQALAMATIEAARALGMEHEIGSLEAGKRADITLVNMLHPTMVPCFNPVSNLVYAATPETVDTVLVNGKIIVQNRQLLTLDEGAVLLGAKQAAQSLARKCGLLA